MSMDQRLNVSHMKREQHFRRLRAKVLLVLIASLLLEIAARVLDSYPWVPDTSRDFLSLLSIFGMVGSGIYLIFRAGGSIWLRLGIWMAAVCLTSSELLNYIENFSAIDAWPVIGGSGIYHSAVEGVLLVLGLAALFTTMYMGLMHAVHMREMLQESEQKFRSAFETSPVGMALVSLHGQFLDMNDALCEIVGYPRLELQRLRFQDITHVDDLEVDLRHAQALLEGQQNSYRLEKRYIHKDGHVVWVLLHGALVRDRHKKPMYFIAQISDITRQRALMEELQRLSTQDDLTGLSNRRTMDTVLAEEWRRSQRDKAPVSLILMDVDFFKPYNDTLGHTAGDECLRSVGQLISKTMRRPGDLGCRYGGEEFAIVLPNTGMEGALRIAENLRAGVEQLAIPHTLSAVASCVTASFGVAESRSEGVQDVKTLVDQADAALYRSKAAGRNQVTAA